MKLIKKKIINIQLPPKVIPTDDTKLEKVPTPSFVNKATNDLNVQVLSLKNNCLGHKETGPVFSTESTKTEEKLVIISL